MFVVRIDPSKCRWVFKFEAIEIVNQASHIANQAHNIFKPLILQALRLRDIVLCNEMKIKQEMKKKKEQKPMIVAHYCRDWQARIGVHTDTHARTQTPVLT